MIHFTLARKLTFDGHQRYLENYTLSGGNFISDKATILERATGKKNVEEWSFLPGTARIYEFDTFYKRTTQNRFRFDKNFVIIIFDYRDADNNIGDLLLLNLVSRKQFWMKRAEVTNKIMIKIPDQNQDDLYDLPRIPLNRHKLRGLVVRENGIQIKYRIHARNFNALGTYSITISYSLYIL